ncbi:MAG: hypothetical protein LBP92_01235 [Deltaproteobacteria bacterium]|nr:hypothetical protein [Deltaproteobacteria bacterium]
MSRNAAVAPFRPPRAANPPEPILAAIPRMPARRIRGMALGGIRHRPGDRRRPGLDRPVTPDERMGPRKKARLPWKTAEGPVEASGHPGPCPGRVENASAALPGWVAGPFFLVASAAGSSAPPE